MERALSKSSRITKVCCGSHFTLALTRMDVLFLGRWLKDAPVMARFQMKKSLPTMRSIFEKNPITQISTGRNTASSYRPITTSTYGEGNDGRLGLGDRQSFYSDKS